MPQIKSPHVEEFVKWLKSNHSIRSVKKMVVISSLKMTQREFNPEKVAGMAANVDAKFLSKLVMMSDGGYILDGHHRVMALQSKDRSMKIKVYHIKTDIKSLLELAHKFPKSIKQNINEENMSFSEFLNERKMGKLKIVKASDFEEKPKLKTKTERKNTGEVTKAQLNALERYLDSVWKNLDIDIEFTKHFLDRVNDSRNGKQITIEELKHLFIEVFKKHGKDINKSGNRHKDIGGVLTDKSSDVNTPFFLKWDNKAKEFELVASTVMRKRSFKPNNPKEKKYVVEEVSKSEFKKFLLNEVLITFNRKAYPKFGNVVILAGGAGSGKGFIMKNLLGIEGKVFDVDALKGLVINSTNLAAKVKRETGEDLKKFDLRNPKNVSRIHEIVSGMKIDKRMMTPTFKSVVSSHPDRKPNLIFDVTLKDVNKLKKLAKTLEDMNYNKRNIHIVWVMNDLTTAVKQNSKRSRKVPLDILLHTHRGAAMTVKEILNMGEGLRAYMDGDIHIAFNKFKVDSEVVVSKNGGSYLKKSDYITVKQAGKAPLDVDSIKNTWRGKINKYISKKVQF